MLSSPKPARALLRPGADFDGRPIPVTRIPERVWFRVHAAGAPVVNFGKRPHHRFSHADCPYPLLYLGATVRTCLWEYFGDDVFQGNRAIPAGKWRGSCLSRVVVPELRVCAVNLERTRDALSVDKGSLLAADLAIPQAWSRAVQGHPAKFEALRYTSRFLDQPCLALFDRGGLSSRLRVTTTEALIDLDDAVDWLDDRNAALV